MTTYGLSRLEHRCVQPGLWEIEGHQVRKLPNRRSTSRNPRGVQWVIVRVNGGGNVPDERNGLTYPTFGDAVDRLADHIEQGCDCP